MKILTHLCASFTLALCACQPVQYSDNNKLVFTVKLVKTSIPHDGVYPLEGSQVVVLIDIKNISDEKIIFNVKNLCNNRVNNFFLSDINENFTLSLIFNKCETISIEPGEEWHPIFFVDKSDLNNYCAHYTNAYAEIIKLEHTGIIKYSFNNENITLTYSL